MADKQTREELVEALRAEGVQTLWYDGKPLTLDEALSDETRFPMGDLKSLLEDWRYVNFHQRSAAIDFRG